MEKKKSSKKAKKIVLISLSALLLIAVAVIVITNITYKYDPTGNLSALGDGEKGVLTLEYNGADGMPESEQIEFSKFEKLTLPTLTKEGYYFSGWTIGDNFVGTEASLGAKHVKAEAQFDKDYSAVKSPCAIYSDEKSFTEYAQGEYPSIDAKAFTVFVDGGYKLTVYDKENFEGKQTKVYYSGKYSGYIGSMKVEKVESEPVEVAELSNDEKLNLLKKYAPRFWWDKNEKYFASTVEFAAENMKKAPTPTGNIYYRDDVKSSSYMNDFLYGDQQNAKAYAFATEKEFKYLDLAYFYYAPYNLGKTIAGLEFGNHIGDWEHISVRLLKEENNGRLTYRPVIVNYSAHFMKNYVSWDEVEKVNGTHPVAYIACGSHGMWKDAGVHVYVNAVVVKLKDLTSKGTAWDLWEDGEMETFAYDALAHKGEGIGESEWKAEFGIDCFDENGGVTNWGNRGWKPPIQVYARFDSAPSGPQHKNSLNDYYTINGQDEM